MSLAGEQRSCREVTARPGGRAAGQTCSKPSRVSRGRRWGRPSCPAQVPVLLLQDALPLPRPRRLRSPHFPLCSGFASAGIWKQDSPSPTPGHVRRGPENNGLAPTLHTGSGWAGLSFQLPALFTSFPRKRNWNRGTGTAASAETRIPGRALSAVLSLPEAGEKRPGRP